MTDVTKVKYPAAKLWGIGMFIETGNKICYGKNKERKCIYGLFKSKNAADG